MKKVLAIFMAIAMMAALSVTAFAANDNFVSSPSGNSAPTVIGSTNGSGSVKINLHSYKDKNSLSDDAKAEFEASFDSIKNAASLTDLNAGIADIAAKNNAEVKDLAVSDVFYTTAEDAEGATTITLKADTFKNFVALMYYSDGEWTIVKDAKLNEDGTLTYTADKFGSYAVLVKTEKTAEFPPTGDNAFVWAIMAAVVLAGASVAVVVKNKRTNALKEHE